MTRDTNLSRRKLLASMPAAAAAMAPAAASALCRLPAEGDDALLALARKLAPLVAETNAARALDQKDQEEFEAGLAALGLKSEEEYEDNDAWFHARLRFMEENEERVLELSNDNKHGSHRAWDDIHDELFALLDEILDIQPTTVEGFAVQVLAIITAHDDLCYESEENAPLPHGVTTFFQNTCRFTGVPIPAAQ